MSDVLGLAAGRVIEGMRGDGFGENQPYSAEELASRVGAYEELSAELSRSVALVGHWSDDAGARLVGRLVGRLANALGRSNGQVPWLKLDRYPALLAMYAAGIGAVAAGREELLAQILTCNGLLEQSRWTANVLVLYPGNVIDHRLAQQLPGLERRHTPVSDHLAEVLGPWLTDIEPDKKAFERTFDRFELLLGLFFYDLGAQRDRGGWAPMGSFQWRYRYGETIWDDLAKEIEDSGDGWPLLKAGSFGGSLERLQASSKAYFSLVASAASHLF
jgi:hypothetical protein